jgi:lysyl-tRNA synthetase class 2
MTRVELLKDRARMLAKARAFFSERGILEVDCPLLTSNASVDLHIDLISALFRGEETRYLHSSPEYGMKRLLSEGIGDCYQLAHVFRDGEVGHKHNPEFMMAEWYRQGVGFEDFILETVEFIKLFLGDLRHAVVSYKQVFEEHLGLDPFKAGDDALMAAIQKSGISYYPSILEEGRDALLNLLLGTLIEPKLGNKQLTVLAYYPESQAALAKAALVDGNRVAKRFEVYYQGVELANGYDELADAKEQRRRLTEANEERLKHGKRQLPIDEAFLAALEQGLPEACGVAVGFDRLMMLRHKKDNIADVIAFDWAQA